MVAVGGHPVEVLLFFQVAVVVLGEVHPEVAHGEAASEAALEAVALAAAVQQEVGKNYFNKSFPLTSTPFNDKYAPFSLTSFAKSKILCLVNFSNNASLNGATIW